jgi:hypothetical protein
MRGIAIGLAVLALAGCSKPADTSNAVAANEAAGNGAAAALPAAPAAPGPAGPITLAQLPSPPAGQWQRVSSQDGAAAETTTKCLSGKPIDPMEGMPMKCAKMDVARTASGGFTIVGDCPNNGMDAKLHMSGEGDFTKTFTTESTMAMTGGPGGP